MERDLSENSLVAPPVLGPLNWGWGGQQVVDSSDLVSLDCAGVECLPHGDTLSSWGRLSSSSQIFHHESCHYLLLLGFPGKSS